MKIYSLTQRHRISLHSVIILTFAYFHFAQGREKEVLLCREQTSVHK